MLTAPERLLAFRYMRSRRRARGFSAVSWLSLLAIALGVCTLVIVTSIMNGLQVDLISRILGVSPHMLIQADAAATPDFDKLQQSIAALPGVTQAAPVVRGDGLAAAGKRSAGARIVGIAPKDLLARRIIADEITEGRLAQFQSPSVVIGAGLARNLGVPIGGKVKLIVPRRDPETATLVPRGRTFIVAAVFETRRDEYDNLLVFLTLPEAQALFETEGRATALDIVMDDPLQVDDVQPQVQSLLGAGELRQDLARSQQLTGCRAAGRTHRHDRHPRPDHHRRGVQHRRRPDDDGEGQGAGDRHPPHHGLEPRLDPAKSSCSAACSWELPAR